MAINSDFRDLLCEFNAADVRYLVVGAYAVFFHAQPRYTKEPTAENAARVFQALSRFGADLSQVTASDFARPGITFQMGVERPAHAESIYGDQKVRILGRAQLLKNKRAVARPQDLLDVAKLEDPKKP